MEAATHPLPIPVERRRPPKEVRRKRLLIAIADHSILIGLSIAFLAPFVFIVLTAFMTNDQALSPRLWPDPFQWGNFADVFHTAPIWRYALNTTIYAVLATTGAAAVMVGRAAQGNPWVLREIVDDDPPEPTREEIVAELMLGSVTMPARMEKTASTPPVQAHHGTLVSPRRSPRSNNPNITRTAKSMPPTTKATSALSAGDCTASRNRLLAAI